MKKINFNENWEYTNIDVKSNKDFARNMTVFKSVDLPHDATMEHPFDKSNPSGRQGGYVKIQTLWYRKYFKINDISAKNRFLLFEGVYNNSTIYINGEKAYNREYGYSSFCVNITKYLRNGLNVIAVHIDGSKEPSTRWFNGQGINRNVYLMESDSIYFKNDSVFIKSNFSENKQTKVSVTGTIFSDFSLKNATLTAVIKDENNIEVAKSDAIQNINIDENKFNLELNMKNTKLWSTENPHLYNSILKIEHENISDELEIKFGVRTLDFIPNSGFYLNGVHTNFKGVCMHHDGGCVGSAVPKALWKKRILQLKEMGCNAIRTSHNPFDPDFYDLCDKLGMMVIDEAFDEWNIPKVKHGYSTIWDKCHAQDTADLVLRDRNHPSVVMWSLGNEVLEMSTEITKELMGIIRNLDDTRKITAGVQATSQVSDDNRALLDVAGYNDGGGACFIYEEDHEKRPQQLFIATEAPHSFQTRGFYRTQTWWRDKNQPRLEIENLTDEEIFFDQNIYYNSSYDNSGVRTSARDSWSMVEKYPYLIGEFRWTGFDYVGEAFPNAWPTKTHSFGVIDSANFPKDHFYLYQSMWTDKKMLHILPHWTHRYMKEGTLVPVWIYTNCEEVELFLNGKCLGKKTKGTLKNLEWKVPYETGILEAKAYENDKLVCSKQVVTAKTPNQIKLNTEKLGDKISQISFEIQDINGNFVPYSNNITGIYLSGDAKLLGSDNGAIDDMSPQKSKIRRAFNGLGMYLVEHTKSSKIVIASILGNEYFDDMTQISLSVKSLDDRKKHDVYYTLDGSKATKESLKYTAPFAIEETTQIKMAVFDGDTELINLSDVFVKGRPAPAIDLTHLNYEMESEKPVGPFSEKITGNWISGACKYIFTDTGELKRKLGMTETTMGYWWYDFPADYLETPDYAGMGEIWLISGEKIEMKLENQKANKIFIDNKNKLLGNIFAGITQVELNKEEIL